MDTHLKQKNRIKENETVVTKANIKSLKTCHSFPYFQGGDKISIIPEDEKASVKPAFWAYGDHILEDLMFGKNYMKCIILVVYSFSENKRLNEKDDVPGIGGVCIHHGGYNYIAFPPMETEGNEVDRF